LNPVRGTDTFDPTDDSSTNIHHEVPDMVPMKGSSTSGTSPFFWLKIGIISCLHGVPQHRQLLRIPKKIFVRHLRAHQPWFRRLAALSRARQRIPPRPLLRRHLARHLPRNPPCLCTHPRSGHPPVRPPLRQPRLRCTGAHVYLHRTRSLAVDLLRASLSAL
jgi:hypothetical protein